MPYFEYEFSNHEVTGDSVPVPDGLVGKDIRADPAARMAVLSSSKLLSDSSKLDRSMLNVIVLTRKGCASHVKKVVDNIEKRVPSQGYFVRGGPQTLATYTALALGCHGCAFTVVGDMDALKDTVAMAFIMSATHNSAGTILTVVTQEEKDTFQGKSILVSTKPGCSDASDNRVEVEKTVCNYLAVLFEGGR